MVFGYLGNAQEFISDGLFNNYSKYQKGKGQAVFESWFDINGNNRIHVEETSNDNLAVLMPITNSKGEQDTYTLRTQLAGRLRKGAGYQLSFLVCNSSNSNGRVKVRTLNSSKNDNEYYVRGVLFNGDVNEKRIVKVEFVATGEESILEFTSIANSSIANNLGKNRFLLLDSVSLHEIKEFGDVRNLVINGDFEQFYELPDFLVKGQNHIVGWNDLGDVDQMYFFSGSKDTSYIGVWKAASQYFGYVDYVHTALNRQHIDGLPYSGEAHVKLKLGMLDTMASTYIGVDYLQGKLSEPLAAGVNYEFSFMFKLKKGAKITTNLAGILFSDSRKYRDTLRDWNGGNIIYFLNQADLNEGEWQKVSLKYKAVGGEKYVHLGSLNCKEININQYADGDDQGFNMQFDKFRLNSIKPK